jgi:hypothetical protein
LWVEDNKFTHILLPSPSHPRIDQEGFITDQVSSLGQSRSIGVGDFAHQIQLPFGIEDGNKINGYLDAVLLV